MKNFQNFFRRKFGVVVKVSDCDAQGPGFELIVQLPKMASFSKADKSLCIANLDNECLYTRQKLIYSLLHFYKRILFTCSNVLHFQRHLRSKWESKRHYRWRFANLLYDSLQNFRLWWRGRDAYNRKKIRNFPFSFTYCYCQNAFTYVTVLVQLLRGNKVMWPILSGYCCRV